MSRPFFLAIGAETSTITLSHERSFLCVKCISPLSLLYIAWESCLFSPWCWALPTQNPPGMEKGVLVTIFRYLPCPLPWCC